MVLGSACKGWHSAWKPWDPLYCIWAYLWIFRALCNYCPSTQMLTPPPSIMPQELHVEVSVWLFPSYIFLHGREDIVPRMELNSVFSCCSRPLEQISIISSWVFFKHTTPHAILGRNYHGIPGNSNHTALSQSKANEVLSHRAHCTLLFLCSHHIIHLAPDLARCCVPSVRCKLPSTPSDINKGGGHSATWSWSRT